MPCCHSPYFQCSHLNGGTRGATRGAAGGRLRSLICAVPVIALAPWLRMCAANASLSVPDSAQISGATMPACPSVRSQRHANRVPCSFRHFRIAASTWVSSLTCFQAYTASGHLYAGFRTTDW
jgi:hypothetical protein